jgi:hypothetical protein
MAVLLNIRLRLLGGLRFESNGDTQKVEVRSARADNGKPNRRAASPLRPED